jgi:glycosyltransferase involved in cell wall biosynthesis
MRILHVQRVRGIAGSENYLFQILPALIKAGVDVSFLMLTQRGEEQANAVFVDRLRGFGTPVDQVHFGGSDNLTVIPRLRQAIVRSGCDIVHSHLVHADAFAAMVRLTLPGMVLVSTKHGYEEDYTNTHGFDPAHRRKDLYFRACQFAERLTSGSYAISRGLRRFFVESGIGKPDHMGVIHYGFDFSSVVYDPDAAQYRKGDPQLVIVGRLVPFKGHRYMLDCMPALTQRFPNLRLVIVGSGPIEAQLRQEIATRGLENSVIMAGYRPNAHDYMRASDVVLVPSVSEGFGAVFLEAFNNHRPVVAFDVPAANEIVESGVSGLLVPPYDTAAMTEAITDLLRNPDRRKALAAGGHARLESYFCRDRMARETIDFYRQMLARKERPAAVLVASPPVG